MFESLAALYISNIDISKNNPNNNKYDLFSYTRTPVIHVASEVHCGGVIVPNVKDGLFVARTQIIHTDFVRTEIIEKQMEVPYLFAPAHLNKQRASAVAVRGRDYFRQGLYVTSDQFEPEYLRMSQAEQERMKKQKKEDK